MVTQPDGGSMKAVPLWMSDEGTLQMVQEPSQKCARVPASFAKPQTVILRCQLQITSKEIKAVEACSTLMRM